MKLFKEMKKVAEGFIKLIKDDNKLLRDERLAACSKCPIKKGNFCASSRGGCGCFLPAKTAHEDESCPHLVWYDNKIITSNLNKVIRKFNKQ
jgi:hypothetical protein